MRASRSRTFTRLRRRGRVLTALLVTLSLLLQVGFQPAAKAATTVTLDFELPEEYARTPIGEWIAELNGRNDLLSDTIREELQAIPGGIPGGLDDWVDFDGTLALRGATLTVTVESEEVLTNLDWWQTLLIDIASTAIYLVIRVICTAALLPESGPLAPLANAGCSALASFFGTFSKGAIKNAVEENPDPNKWSNLLIDSFVDAAKGAMWDGVVGPVTNQFGAKMFSWVARKLVEVGRKIKAYWWAGNLGLTMESAAGTVTSHTHQYLEEIELAARRSGSRALRVLPLGDSITYGQGGSPDGVGYRARLWSELQDDTSSLDFVGSLDSGHGSIPDTDHEGHRGWRISQIDTLAAECAIARYRPNVVVLHIGTNDLANGEQHTSALTRLGTLINNIDDIAPLTTVIVSTLVPSTNQAVDSRIALFNSYLPAAVNTWRAEGKRVRLARVLGLTSADMVDALHPNNNGYRKMADTYHNAINSAMDEGLIKPALLGDDRVCAPEPGNPTPGTPPNGVMEGWHRFDGAGGMIAAGVPGGTREGLRFADIDGDGRDDYLMTDSAGRVSAWGNALPSPRWAEMGEVAAGVSGGTRDGLRFADLNGDGRDDYLMVDPQGRVRAWGNAVPSPRWTEWGQVAAGVPGATREEVRFADMDCDGRDDYLLVDPQGRVRAWLNVLPTKTWTEWGQVAAGVSGGTRENLRFADVNGDGCDDYLMVGPQGQVRAWGNVLPNRTWTELGEIAAGIGLHNSTITFADVDGDGRDDYLSVNDCGRIWAWRNTGSSTWPLQGEITTGLRAPSRDQVFLGDINGDRRLDYLLSDPAGVVTAWHGNGQIRKN